MYCAACAACSASLLVPDPWSRARGLRSRKCSSGAAGHALGRAGHVTMAVAGQRRGAPGSVVVDSKAAAPHTLHAARLLYGNRDLPGTGPSSWRDVYGGRTASPMTRTMAVATARKERDFHVTKSTTDGLPAVKSVATSSSCGALTGDKAVVDAQSSRKRRGGNRKRVRGSPDSNDAGDGPPVDGTHGLHFSMQHAALWDGEFRGGSQADFRDDRDRLLDQSGVPLESWKATETAATTSGPAAAQGNANAIAYDDGTGYHRQGNRLPVLSTLGAESDDCGASVDTGDTRPPRSRGSSRARRRKNTGGTGSDSTKRDRAVGRPAGRGSSAHDGGSSLSRLGQTDRHRQRQAAAEKEAVITRMLQTFSAPSDGKSTRRSDFVNMVSFDGIQTNYTRTSIRMICTTYDKRTALVYVETDVSTLLWNSDNVGIGNRIRYQCGSCLRWADKWHARPQVCFSHVLHDCSYQTTCVRSLRQFPQHLSCEMAGLHGYLVLNS